MTPFLGPDRRQYQRGRVAGTAAVFPLSGGPGEYLIEDLSAGGARLLGCVCLGVGTPMRVALRMSGSPVLWLNAVVVRATALANREAEVAVAFRGASLEVQAKIQRAVMRTRLRAALPSVLVVDPDVRVLARVVADLMTLGCESILAYRPAEAIRWLAQPEGDVAVALVGTDLGGVRGEDVLALVSQRSPRARTALMGRREQAGSSCARRLSLPPNPLHLAELVTPAEAKRTA
jgi:hypothetical protein